MSAAEANGELLIVEDDLDFVEDIFAMWTPPLPVAHASSGEEAFEYLRTGVPALVLLDLNLPHYLADDDDAEGLEILSYIKNRVGSDIPVIVVTRENSREMRSRAISLGAREFIPKPLDVSNLEEAVRSVMREHPGCSS
jgi:two-component system chemotaxis response regulator CheY